MRGWQGDTGTEWEGEKRRKDGCRTAGVARGGGVGSREILVQSVRVGRVGGKGEWRWADDLLPFSLLTHIIYLIFQI